MFKNFKTVAHAEAYSLLALFFIAMPLKYLAGQPLAVRVVGMVHGLLFMIYIYWAIQLAVKYKWPVSKLVWICAISSIPLGPFLFEKKLFEQDLKLD